MEDIEQLKLENDKLKERLNNAAKFFREQKAQIETLNKENEELKSKALNSESQADWEAKYIELKETIERTPKEEVISTEKWNALVTEKESLKEQLATSNAACTDMEKAIHKNLEDIEKLNKENDKLKSDYTVLNDEYLNNENILSETLAANKELVESNKHFSEQNNDLNLKIDALECELKVCKELVEVGEKIKKTHSELKNVYEKLNNDFKNTIAENSELKKTNEKLTNEVTTYKSKLTETEEALNNAENVIATINTAVNYHTETAARKKPNENKIHRIGDEQVMGHNIGI